MVFEAHCWPEGFMCMRCRCARKLAMSITKLMVTRSTIWYSCAVFDTGPYTLDALGIQQCKLLRDAYMHANKTLFGMTAQDVAEICWCDCADALLACACRALRTVLVWTAYLKDRDLYRNDSANFVLGCCIVLFAKRHDVHTLQHTCNVDHVT